MVAEQAKEIVIGRTYTAKVTKHRGAFKFIQQFYQPMLRQSPRLIEIRFSSGVRVKSFY